MLTQSGGVYLWLEENIFSLLSAIQKSRLTNVRQAKYQLFQSISYAY